MKTLDLRGLTCPLPLLRTKKALMNENSGMQFKILSSDPNASKDLHLFCEKSGNLWLESGEENGAFFCVIQKK